MATSITLLGPDGRALPIGSGRGRKPLALAGGANVPYDAADIYGDHMAAWQPYLWSVDGELNPWRDRIVSRVRDAVRNDGWASGTVTRILDNAMGASFRPIAKPDYRALAAYSGIKAFDADWADEFGKVVSSYWRTWAHDPGRYCDTQRRQTMPQMMRLGFRHKLVDGDALAMLRWMPERIGLGRARFATALQIIDPDRLSNPQLRFDQQTMRGGVEVDENQVAVAYWIRRAHQGDWFSAADSLQWDRIPRETAWGRPIIVHDFDSDRAPQHRGGAGVLAPVLQRLKMLIKYDGTELDAAIINAIFGAYLESPYDPQVAEAALGDDDIGKYQDGRVAYHEKKKITLGSARMPILFPGEKIGVVNAARPTSNFESFEGAVLRNVAAGAGVASMQVDGNWTNVNYSSARGALLEAWKTLHRRRLDYGAGFGQPVYTAFIEELFDAVELPLPAGAPDFLECRTEYARCKWLGPGRGWVDPVAEKKGAVLGMDAGLSTLEAECAENVGEDWEEVLDQRQREIQAFKDRGIPVPTWAGMQDKPAEETITDPKVV